MMKKQLLAFLLILALGLTARIAAQVPDKAVDPVCGMSVVKAGAKWTYDYKGTTYYFCSESCKTSFSKEPEKFLVKTAEVKEMRCGMKCPLMMAGIDKKIENTKDGVIITLTSKNPETVKKLQEHLAKMNEASGTMKKDCAAEGMHADCPKKIK